MTSLAPSELAHYHDVAIAAAAAGGEILQRHWKKLEGYDEKNISGDLVTLADRESEKVVFAILREAFPDHALLGEESGLQPGGADNEEFLWAIDPLDGTTNYAHTFPVVSVSVSLLHRREPIVGAVFNPLVGELFACAQGHGAFLNGERLAVSHTATLSSSLLATGFAYDRSTNPDTNYKEFCHFTSISHGVRRLGSAALDLAYVAAGRLDGFWERGLNIWDIAAGIALVREAGGKVSDYNLSPVDFRQGRILATNGILHDAMSHTLMMLRHS